MRPTGFCLQKGCIFYTSPELTLKNPRVQAVTLTVSANWSKPQWTPQKPFGKTTEGRRFRPYGATLGFEVLTHRAVVLHGLTTSGCLGAFYRSAEELDSAEVQPSQWSCCWQKTWWHELSELHAFSIFQSLSALQSAPTWLSGLGE